MTLAKKGINMTTEDQMTKRNDENMNEEIFSEKPANEGASKKENSNGSASNMKEAGEESVEENGIDSMEQNGDQNLDPKITEIDKAHIQSLKSELETSQSETKNNYDKYLRAVAEMENLRRRSEKEKSSLRQFALENVCKDLLPVLDSFDRALAEQMPKEQDEKAAPNNDSFIDGMLMVKKQFIEILEKQGLEIIEAVGQKFDPNVHQAIQRVESKDTEDERVKDEYSKGYTLNGRLLRPAMVSVMVPSES